MKRKVIAVLTAAVLVLPMAGCAGGGSKASSAASEAKSAAEEAVSKAESAAEEAVSEAKSAAEEAASEAKSAAEEAASEAESAVAEAASEAESAAEEAASKAESAVEEAASEAESAAAEAASEAESAVAEAASEAEEGGLSLDGTVMTFEEYAAAELDTPVLVETYVQAKQSWFEGAATVYTQSEDGAYFLYNMPCTEEEYGKLTEGTKIKVAGYKSEYAGEVEIIDTIFEIEDGNYTAEAADVTDLLGKDELGEHMNQKVAFKGLTIEPSKAEDSDEEAAFLYSWNGSGQEGDDLYFNASINGETYTFTVESYLCDASSDVYKAVQGLKIGDVIDMEGFLYWYEGPNPHITAVTAAK